MCSRLLHHSNDVRYCITHFLFVQRYTSFKPTARARTLALAPSRSLQNTSTQHAVSSWLLDPGRCAVHTKAYYNGRIWKWTSQDLFCTEDRSRIAPGGPPFFALDNCGNVRWECRFKAILELPRNLQIPNAMYMLDQVRTVLKSITRWYFVQFWSRLHFDDFNLHLQFFSWTI